jgi:hypothetical protein
MRVGWGSVLSGALQPFSHTQHQPQYPLVHAPHIAAQITSDGRPTVVRESERQRGICQVSQARPELNRRNAHPVAEGDKQHVVTILKEHFRVGLPLGLTLTAKEPLLRSR